jgi:hypothetical protein
VVGTFDRNLRLLRYAWRWDELVNGAGMTVLGCSVILPVSRLSSAILADLDMRGNAISVSTLVPIVLFSTFLRMLLFKVS